MLVTTFAYADSPTKKPNLEAISGMPAQDDRSAWESYYRRKGSSTIDPPVEVVKLALPYIKPNAQVFCPAMGEGRNAIFLSEKGFRVDGNDISETAVQKVKAEARARKLELKAAIGDLTQMHLPQNYYDVVVLSYFYMTSLVPKWKSTLKSGGVIVIQERNPEKKIKRNSNLPSEFDTDPTEIENDFSGWKLLSKKIFNTPQGQATGLIYRKP